MSTRSEPTPEFSQLLIDLANDGSKCDMRSILANPLVEIVAASIGLGNNKNLYESPTLFIVHSRMVQ